MAKNFMNDIKITVNTDSKTPFDLSSWNISDENNRVSIRYNNKEYSVIMMDDGSVNLEKWEVDSNGELMNIAKTYQNL